MENRDRKINDLVYDPGFDAILIYKGVGHLDIPAPGTKANIEHGIETDDIFYVPI